MSRRRRNGDVPNLPSPRDQQEPGYEVGYGKPPKHTRFQKGQSGNPRGRPKGARNKQQPSLPGDRLKEIILDEAYRTIPVRDGDGHIDVPMAQAVFRAIAVNAAKGQSRAQRLFTDLVSDVEKDRRRRYDDYLEAMVTYKLNWEEELERRARVGDTSPPPLPHPDDIIINMRTDEVEIVGPITKEEKQKRDRLIWVKDTCRQEIETLEEELSHDSLHPDIREEFSGYLETHRRVLARAREALPDDQEAAYRARYEDLNS